MQIVIDIPDIVWEKAKEYGHLDICGIELSEKVMNGVPLPKGHGDLIDVNKKITVSIYDEQYEEWSEKTLTVLEALNKWSDEGVTVKDVVIPADKAESEG